MIMFVLDDPTKTLGVLEAWARVGVSGATVLESSGLGRALNSRDDLPLIPSLRAVLSKQEHDHRTLFSVLADSFDLAPLIAETELVTGPLADPHTGILIVVPVMQVVGLREGETLFTEQ
jgi:hypothetical protein